MIFAVSGLLNIKVLDKMGMVMKLKLKFCIVYIAQRNIKCVTMIFGGFLKIAYP